MRKIASMGPCTVLEGWLAYLAAAPCDPADILLMSRDTTLFAPISVVALQPPTVVYVSSCTAFDIRAPNSKRHEVQAVTYPA